jgi:hypothetical protein
MIPYNLIVSALQKYKDVIHLMENGQYESALIIFRAFYENLIIMYFLNYNDCHEEFLDFSFYKLFKNNNDNDEMINEKIVYIKEKYGEDVLKTNYGWAKKVIDKTKGKIYFKELLNKVMDNTEFIQNMYSDLSSLVHSNSSLLIDYKFEDILMIKLKIYLEKFGIPILTRCFFDIFCDNYHGDANIFLRICEICMEKYNIVINIR